MSGASREKTQADFDLERIISVLDEAMTSDDPRVLECLRNLMMIASLVKPEVRGEDHARRSGPLRQLFEDMHGLNRRLARVEGELRTSGLTSIHDMEKRSAVQQVTMNRVNAGVFGKDVCGDPVNGLSVLGR